ncbi:MAG TPA: wax ester/triacylglycerol synthase domain-containing protein [Acidimicrobiales bacterium]|nr:wax ester/triacylglycerol synthase domain-containing protein [Acidimicrobiales bacterium]
MSPELSGFGFDRHMNGSDAVLWTIEADPVLRSTILFVLVFDRPPDRRRLVERLELATRALPRLRQRVVVTPVPGVTPRWVTEPEVDLAYHLRFARAPGQGTMRDLLDLARPMVMQGFDRARPPWEFTVVEGLEHGRAGLIQKVHHSVTDGVAGIRLALALLDLEADPAAPPEAPDRPPPPDRTGPLDLVAEAVAYQGRRNVATARGAVAGLAAAARDPLGAVHRAAGLALSAGRILLPAPTPLSPVMRGRSIAVRLDTITVPLPELKAAAHQVGGTLNDAFMAAMAGGLGRYHRAKGLPVDRLRVAMPVNVRAGAAQGEAGNRFVPARFELPVAIADPRERMAAVRDLVARVRAEPVLPVSEAVARLLYRLPHAATVAVFADMLKGVDMLASNVAGASFPVYLAGARALSSIAFGPMTGAASNVTLLSYVGDVSLGISTDPAAVDDPELFVACLGEGLDEIRALA